MKSKGEKDQKIQSISESFTSILEALLNIIERMHLFILEKFDPESGKSLKYRQLLKHPKYHEIWARSSANEFGQPPKTWEAK
mgnify:CR=1 FL=1